MREKAKKLLAKIYSAKYGCIDLVMKAFEDVAVSFAWEMLLGYKAVKSTVTVDQLKASWRDYATPLPFRPNYTSRENELLSRYPPYKTALEIVEEQHQRYLIDKISKYPKPKYYKCPHCATIFLDDGRTRCPWCRSPHIYHITPNREKFEKKRQIKENYIQANKHLHGISKYYKCLSCDHTFLDVGPCYCPRCSSIHLEPLFDTMYKRERERIQKQVSRYYHTCSCCGHTYLGRDYCPRCDTEYMENREKFLNTCYQYGYLARPGINLSKYHCGIDPYKSPTVEDIKNLYEFGRKDVEATDDKGLPVGYISYEDMAYLWECMPKYIKYGSCVADNKIRTKVKRILRK